MCSKYMQMLPCNVRLPWVRLACSSQDWHAQVQGLMEVFGRDWCNLWVWTVNGAVLWHFPRDRAYWAECYDVLAQYWWASVIPAKHALAAGGGAAAAECFRWVLCAHLIKGGLSCSQLLNVWIAVHALAAASSQVC